LQLQHVEPKGNSPLNVGSPDGVFYIARTKILTELQALQIAVSANNITFTNIYTQHTTADLQLNAMSFEIINADYEDQIKDSTRDVIVIRTTFEVRVHTGYSGRARHADWNLILLDYVQNHFATNRDLDSPIDNIRFAGSANAETSTEFDDSGTTGARLEIEIRSGVEYTQA